MPRKPSAKVVLARGALSEVVLAIADGMAEAGRTIIETAHAPDSPLLPYPTGEGLPKQGGVLTFVDGKKVSGWSQRGVQPKKPRAAQPGKGATTIVGWGFPARFVDRGTIRTPAQPFAEAARDAVAPIIPAIIGRVSRPKIGGKSR